MSKAAKKNIKRREKKKEKMAVNETQADSLAGDVDTMRLSISVPNPTSTDDEKQKEQIRQLRALRKKLKQVVELQARRDAGEKLEPEQLEKIGRQKAIEEEMGYLEMEIMDNWCYLFLICGRFGNGVTYKLFYFTSTCMYDIAIYCASYVIGDIHCGIAIPL